MFTPSRLATTRFEFAIPALRGCSRVSIIFGPPAPLGASGRESILVFPSTDCAIYDCTINNCIIADGEETHQCHPSRGERDKCHLCNLVGDFKAAGKISPWSGAVR